MIEQFIRQYGLMAVFVGVAVEGDATMIFAGVSAHLNLLSFFSVCIVGTVAGWVGDTFYYLLGRFAGGYFNKGAKIASASTKAERFTKKFGVWSIFLSRFIWGTRMATMAFWGFHHLSFIRYAIVDLIGCMLWATLLGSLGYCFSKSAELLIGRVRQLEIWLLAAFMITIILVLIFHLIYKKRRRKTLAGLD
ncbi:MAG: DedA family protein [Acidobacteriota bacterium]